MIAASIPAIGAILVYALPRTNIGGQMVGIYLVCGDSSRAGTYTDVEFVFYFSFIHTLGPTF